MKQISYAGLDLEEDIWWVHLIKDAKTDIRFNVLSTPNECEVLERKYTRAFSCDTELTGERHIGYEYHYLVLESKETGNIYHINSPSLPKLPRTNVTTFLRTGENKNVQASYPFDFNGLDELHKMCKVTKPLSGCGNCSIK